MQSVSETWRSCVSADFFGGLVIVTIGTGELDDPLPIAAADGGCDVSFS